MAAGLASRMADRGTPLSEARTANPSRVIKEVNPELLEADSGLSQGRNFWVYSQPLTQALHTYTVPAGLS